MYQKLLRIENLKTYFYTHFGVARAVDELDLSLKHGQIIGIVGESGCGKRVSALSILRWIKDPPGKIIAGEVLFEGKDLLQIPLSEMRNIRGNQISMIFQEPMTSLNPLFKIGGQISESCKLHQGLSKRDALDKSVEILEIVGIPAAKRRVRDYPHQLSGGMRQRVMIAMALSCEPKILIADEPTTALDVSIQVQVMNLLQELQQKLGLTYLFISHDLSVVRHLCDRIAVMYLGRIVEMSPTEALHERALHPYTRALLSASPIANPDLKRKRVILKGDVPNPINPPIGCHFHTRCPEAKERCRKESPPLVEASPDH